MNTVIPFDLREQIQKGDCILLVGNELPQEFSLLPDSRGLARMLAARCECEDAGQSLPQAAQTLEVKFGRKVLIDALEECLSAVERPAPFHRLVAQGPIRVVISTAYDQLLEAALVEARRPFVKIVRDEEISFFDSSRFLLIKLYGSIEQRGTLVLTQDDHLDLFDRSRSLPDVIGSLLATKTLLFAGFDLTATDFQLLYRSIFRRSRSLSRRAYCLAQAPTENEVRYWERENLEIITTPNPVSYLEQLFREAARPASAQNRQPAGGGTVPFLKRPYKYLDYYRAEDADIFFGRSEESRKLVQKILSHRFVVLTGKSGSGKTSLLNAAVTPLLQAQNYLPVSVRVGDNLLKNIKDGLAAHLEKEGEPAPGFQADLTLRDCLRATIEDRQGTLAILVDQFEEFFIQHTPEVQRKCIREIIECLEDLRLDFRLVLSIREDYFVRLTELAELIPNVYYNIFRVTSLNSEQARQAIEAPLGEVGLTIEAGLVDRLLQDLGRDGAIDPPQLQILCDTLFDKLPPGETRITGDMYDRLGGAEKVLAAYLDLVIERLPRADQDKSRQLLKRLVTSQSTKVGLVSEAEIVEGTDDQDQRNLERCLNHLVNVRLVRRTLAEGERQYELAHDYLALRIREWMNADEIELAQVHELIRREMNSWRQLGTLLKPVDLDLIYNWAEKLNPPADALVFAWLSAKACSHMTYGYWSTEIQRTNAWSNFDESQNGEALAKTLSRNDRRARNAAIEALGKIGTTRAAETLVRTIQSEGNYFYRLNAAAALRKIPGSVDLVAAGLANPDLRIQSNAAEALLSIGSPAAMLKLEEYATRSKAAAAAADSLNWRMGLFEHAQALSRGLLRYWVFSLICFLLAVYFSRPLTAWFVTSQKIAEAAGLIGPAAVSERFHFSSIVAGIGYGWLLAFPYLLFEIWNFVGPGLTPRPRILGWLAIFSSTLMGLYAGLAGVHLLPVLAGLGGSSVFSTPASLEMGLARVVYFLPILVVLIMIGQFVYVLTREWRLFKWLLPLLILAGLVGLAIDPMYWIVLVVIFQGFVLVVARFFGKNERIQDFRVWIGRYVRNYRNSARKILFPDDPQASADLDELYR